MSKPPGQRVQFTKFDFPAMLPANAPWQTAAARVAVMRIGNHTMSLYPDLQSVVAMTNQHPFKIATEGSMVATGGLCERNGMEGLDAAQDFAREIVGAIRRWKAAGGRLDYVVMDSPLYFGYYASAKDCRFSIAEVARRSAATFREIQKLYPAIRLMDAEGPGPTTVDRWLPDFKQWLDAFKRETGHPIDAVGLDLHWDDAWHTGYNWVQAARQITLFLHHEGIAAGLYINADNKNPANADWMNANRAHLQTAARAHMGLDFVLFASWMTFPERNLPESDQNAYTSLVNDAFAAFAGGR